MTGELKRMKKRQLLGSAVNLGEGQGRQQSGPADPRAPTEPACPAAGLVVTSALIIWKTLMLLTGSESPVRGLDAATRARSCRGRRAATRIDCYVGCAGSSSAQWQHGAWLQARRHPVPQHGHSASAHRCGGGATARRPAPATAPAGGAAAWQQPGSVWSVQLSNGSLMPGMQPAGRRAASNTHPLLSCVIPAGEVVVFNINGRDIPIVHRVIKVHERADENHLDILTKVG